MTRVVTDATVLIYLANLDAIELLDECFDEVLLPPAVYDEVVERGRSEGYPDAIAIDEATEEFLEVRELSAEASDRAAEIRDTANLGAGEAEALALAEETAARCLTDDHAARQTAAALDVGVGGTIYVLLESLDRGLYSLDEYVECLDELESVGFRMSGRLYRRAVEAGEDRFE
jgi:predicted nucleic acid-binding protein